MASTHYLYHQFLLYWKPCRLYFIVCKTMVLYHNDIVRLCHPRGTLRIKINNDDAFMKDTEGFIQSEMKKKDKTIKGFDDFMIVTMSLLE